MSKNPVLNTYNFVSTWNRKRPLDSSQYKLIIRQQPKQARLCSNKERDRRPVDPPPIIQLKIEGYSEEAHPYYFMCANLVHPAQENNEHYNMSPRVLTGTVVSSLHKLKDIDNQDGGFFVFGDISVRVEGRYRLRFSLFEIIGDEVVHILSNLSDVFNVYSPKTFPGMSESTFLSRSFSDQGVKIRIRKEHRIQMKRPPTRLTESGEDQDLLEEENAKKKRRPTFPSVDVPGGVFRGQAMSSPTSIQHPLKPAIEYPHQQRTQDGSTMRSPYLPRHLSDYPSTYNNYDDHSYGSVRDDNKASLVDHSTSYSRDPDSPHPVYTGELFSEPQHYSNSIYSPISSPKPPRSASFPTASRSVDTSNQYILPRRHPLASSASLDVPRTNSSQYSLPSRSTTAMTTGSSTSSTLPHYGRNDSLSSNSSLSSTSTPYYPSHPNYSISPKSRSIHSYTRRRSSTTNGLLTPPQNSNDGTIHYQPIAPHPPHPIAPHPPHPVAPHSPHPIAPHPIAPLDNHNKNNISSSANNIATPSYTAQFTDSPRMSQHSLPVSPSMNSHRHIPTPTRTFSVPLPRRRPSPPPSNSNVTLPPISSLFSLQHPMKRSLSNDHTYTPSDNHPLHHYPQHHNTEHQPLSLHQSHDDRRSLAHHSQTSGQLPPHDSGIASGGEDPGRSWNRY
ncbi:2818_t:CDS:2 [Paraglomus brasilianum]|uniref:2818_t:CDS:1 n=1 Tax=Paraglomus brasilianum TaxID=144538 RepID=A0A9N9B4I3_9GLOM|nr:2818_t:CDS:2 [Paraglomus brasilianum]